jgi:hypothetical protein
MKQVYQTQIYSVLESIAFYIAFFMILLAIIFYISVLLRIPILGAIGFILLCIVPFFFQKKIKLQRIAYEVESRKRNYLTIGAI